MFRGLGLIFYLRLWFKVGFLLNSISDFDVYVGPNVDST